MKATTTRPISPNDTINELIARHPAILTVFHEYGIDACCGGALTLAAVAERHGFDPDALLDDLGRAVPG